MANAPSTETAPAHRPLLAVFVTLALALLASVAAMFAIGLAALRSNEGVVREQFVIDHLRETLITMADAETGQRGYLLTHREEYLQPYWKARGQLEGRLRTLGSLTREDELPADEVKRYVELAKAKFDELESTIEVNRSQGSEAALQRVLSGSGKNIMDQIRTLSSRMIKREEAQVSRNIVRSKRLGNYGTGVFVLAAVVNLSFLAWAYRRIEREQQAREKLSTEVVEQKELLEVTLASIGDGVLVTDKNSRITFMNDTAEQLTGWTEREAEGQSCATVFNIINEATRRVVESPVDKVLRLGAVVGLANHTLLIRKDGTEIPIDDSGAPIRHRDGSIRGVVLIFRDFSDHKKAEAELRDAKEEAEAANIAKDNFLANLSHELRTPLTPVAATLAIWESDHILPDKLLPDLEMMRRNVNLEARLIDDLLDLTRIVRGKLTLSPEVADVNELIQSVAGMYQSEVRAKRLSLTITPGAERIHVFADPARLQQVFWNVLKNATKFTPEGGHIDVTISTLESGQVEVIVRDDGIGMPETVLEKLFQPFEQGAADVVKRYGGLGLGMAISRALMEAQGGSIRAESPGPGRGSTFIVTLPAVGEPTMVGEPTQVNERPIVQKSLQILIVEDDQDTARVLSRLLQRWGHRIVVGATVAEGKALADASSFDVILSDIGLPDGTGMELIQHIRLRSHALAIALSGFGMEADVAECMEAGFNEHITKPINLQRLEMLIQRVEGKD
jgi:PAS domain S-box-containing protein